MTSIPSQPQSIGRILDAGIRLSFRCFKSSIAVAVLGAVLISLPSLMFMSPDALVAGGSGFWIVFGVLYIIGWVGYVMCYSCIIHHCNNVALGRAASIKTSFALAAVKLPVLFVATFLYALAAILGLVLLIIPGILFGVSLIFYANRVILEDDGPVSSLRNSHTLVWGNWWRTFAIFSVITVIYVVLYMGVGIPLAFIEGLVLELPPGQGPLSLAGQAIGMAIVLPCFCAVFVMTYHDLKLRREGSDLANRIDSMATPR